MTIKLMNLNNEIIEILENVLSISRYNERQFTVQFTNMDTRIFDDNVLLEIGCF